MRATVPALFIGALVALVATEASAGMNYRCLAACEQAGSPRQACTARCKVAVPRQAADPTLSAKHGTDYRCVDRCTGTGRPRPYCLRNCSY
jgi:hypothetical protein